MRIHEFMRYLLESRGLSCADVATVAGTGRAVVNKAETEGLMVRGRTLVRLLAGMGIRPADDDYGRAVELWTAGRVGIPSSGLRQRLMARIETMTPDQLDQLKTWMDKRLK